MSHIEKTHGLYEQVRANGGSAFPSREVTMLNMADDGSASPVYSDTLGMSLRDYYAGQALAEFAGLVTVDVPETMRVVAGLSYKMADAMLAARAKGD
jgi:hypothetical protein